MSKLRLLIETPEKQFFAGDAESVIMDTLDGEIGVLPGHLPMIAALVTGHIRINAGGTWREAALSEGFAQIKNETVIIMADTAEWPEDIDVNRALEAKQRTEERLKSRQSEIEYMRAQIALKRALNRLSVSGKNT
jgi:F-type H+-transporting ATPase subunit epsilon